MKTKKLTSAQRFAILHGVLNRVYVEAESWHSDNIGSSLAYLCLAIADGKADSFVDWSSDVADTAEIRRLFERCFVKLHPVWRFIEV